MPMLRSRRRQGLFAPSVTRVSKCGQRANELTAPSPLPHSNVILVEGEEDEKKWEREREGERERERERVKRERERERQRGWGARRNTWCQNRSVAHTDRSISDVGARICAECNTFVKSVVG